MKEELVTRARHVRVALPGATEAVSCRHPVFRVGGKTFSALKHYQGGLVLAVKVGREMQTLFLADPRYCKEAYAGNQGWVSLRLGGEPNWDEVVDACEDNP